MTEWTQPHDRWVVSRADLRVLIALMSAQAKHLSDPFAIKLMEAKSVNYLNSRGAEETRQCDGDCELRDTDLRPFDKWRIDCSSSISPADLVWEQLPSPTSWSETTIANNEWSPSSIVSYSPHSSNPDSADAADDMCTDQSTECHASYVPPFQFTAPPCDLGTSNGVPIESYDSGSVIPCGSSDEPMTSVSTKRGRKSERLQKRAKRCTT